MSLSPGYGVSGACFTCDFEILPTADWRFAFPMSTGSYGDCDDDDLAHRSHLERMVAYYARTATQYNSWHCDPANNSSHSYAVREMLALMTKLRAKTLLDVLWDGSRGPGRFTAGFDTRGIDVSKT